MGSHGKQEGSDRGQSSKRSRERKDRRAEESSRIEERIEIEGNADLQLKPVDLMLYKDFILMTIHYKEK